MGIVQGALQQASPVALRSFFAAAHFQSRRRAAEELGTHEPLVSKHITDLETLLGISLLKRQPPRNWIVTAQGQILYEALLESYKVLGGAEQKIKNQQIKKLNSRLNVYTTVPYGSIVLPDLNVQFMEKNPKVQVIVRTVSQLPEFEIDEVDVLIWALQETPWRTEALELADLSLHLYASTTYLKARGTPKTIQDLSKHRVILHNTTGSVLHNITDIRVNYNPVWIEALLEKNNVTPLGIIESNNSLVSAQYGLKGHGIISYADEMVPFLGGDLRRVLPEVKGPQAKMYFCYAKKNKEHPALMPYYNFLKKVLSQVKKPRNG